jgi:hypothetical protein
MFVFIYKWLKKTTCRMKQKRRKDAKLVHAAANQRNLETGELGLAKKRNLELVLAWQKQRKTTDLGPSRECSSQGTL